MRTFSVGLLCFVLGVLAVPAGVYGYLRWGKPPVAVDDPAFPMEKQIVHMPLNARIAREMPAEAPFAADDASMLAGAQVYSRNCAFCHGVPGHPSALGAHMYPPAPQLWKSHRAGVVGVSDDPAGESYWKVKNGIRLTAMPSYRGVLTEQQMWQVTLLLKAADQPLQPAVQQALIQNQ